MSRDLKFRAWIISQECYFAHDIGLLPEGVFEVGFGGTVGTFLPWDKVVVEQFTGLHDKNGKEIYEGDIVDCSGGPYKVIWDNEKPGFWLTNHHCGGAEISHGEPVEVIGNIHENPELIK